MVACSPRSSQILSTYVASANGVAPAVCSHCHGFHTTWVALPEMVLREPPVGPTGYVLPLAPHEAMTVSDVGWTLLISIRRVSYAHRSSRTPSCFEAFLSSFLHTAGYRQEVKDSLQRRQIPSKRDKLILLDLVKALTRSGRRLRHRNAARSSRLWDRDGRCGIARIGAAGTGRARACLLALRGGLRLRHYEKAVLIERSMCRAV